MDKVKLIKAEIERRKERYYEKEQDAWDGNEYGDEDAYFYQGKRKMCEEILSFIDTLDKQPSEDLEKLAEEYANSIAQFDMQRIYSKDDFKAGWKACKEQMLKDAVEGRIGEVGFHNAVYLQEPKWTNFLDGFKKGDKIRIIVLPKED